MRRLSGNDPEVNEEWITDKDRFAFHYATAGDRLTYPQVRDDETASCARPPGPRRSRSRPAAWPRLPTRAASACCPAAGSPPRTATPTRKFARVALGTNDIDFRARPLSAEEASFLAAHVVLTGPGNGAATYADLERANTVLLAGFEPEDEAGAVFLRLRKAAPRRPAPRSSPSRRTPRAACARWAAR